MRVVRPLSVHPRIVTCLLRRLRVTFIASIRVVVSVVGRILTGLRGCSACGSSLVVLLRLTRMVLFEGGSIRGLLHPTLVLGLSLRLRLRPSSAKGIVCIRGGIVGVDARGTAAAFVDLDICQSGIGDHRVVSVPIVLATAGDDIKNDSRHLRDEGSHRKGKQNLVYSADHDTGSGTPIGGVTSGRERTRHTPTQQSERRSP